jgi:hypothetical protein
MNSPQSPKTPTSPSGPVPSKADRGQPAEAPDVRSPQPDAGQTAEAEGGQANPLKQRGERPIADVDRKVRPGDA